MELTNSGGPSWPKVIGWARTAAKIRKRAVLFVLVFMFNPWLASMPF
jgi:hypothetical protein